MLVFRIGGSSTFLLRSNALTITITITITITRFFLIFRIGDSSTFPLFKLPPDQADEELAPKFKLFEMYRLVLSQ